MWQRSASQGGEVLEPSAPTTVHPFRLSLLTLVPDGQNVIYSTIYGPWTPFLGLLGRGNAPAALLKGMATTKPAAARPIEPPANAMTDTIRLNFYELTGMVLPHLVCQTCWLNIVGMSLEAIDRGAILTSEHECPHYVEPDVVLYHALQGLPAEGYWGMADPWSERL